MKEMNVAMWLAAEAHRPERRVSIIWIDIFIDGDNPFALGASE
jgi:hypothetical protein